MDLYIGLMSGTSMDSIDGALVDFSSTQPELIATYANDIESELKQQLLELCQPSDNEIVKMARLDGIVGKKFAETTNLLINKAKIDRKEIKAIGSHGQTIRHSPQDSKPFTLQIGDPNTIAAATGIKTVADFRRRDVALGGQGAPLTPAFHKEFFHSPNIDRVILNIGGIANITIIPKNLNSKIIGYDTGPGNTLLDSWITKNLNQNFDNKGKWASTGTVDTNLLHNLIADEFFKSPPPKSTGTDYFNLNWLNKFSIEKIKPENIQATLTELTALSIAREICKHLRSGEVYICGGGAFNNFLLNRLQELLSNFTINQSSKLNFDPKWIEAMAFAWFAKQNLEGKTTQLTSITGAKEDCILGGLYNSNK